MNINEFKSIYEYRNELKESKYGEEDVRPKSFTSIVPAILQSYPEILVRDYLNEDCTYAVIFRKTKTPTAINAIKLYQDVIDIIKSTCYLEAENNGFFELNDYEGFWILFE